MRVLTEDVNTEREPPGVANESYDGQTQSSCVGCRRAGNAHLEPEPITEVFASGPPKFNTCVLVGNIEIQVDVQRAADPDLPITCGGNFDSSSRSYQSNIVVYAALVAAHPA